jgi:predicted lactoylglutathione lyase
MSTMLLVYLPVTDLERSTCFFDALGFACDQPFPVANMKALVINDDSRVVLTAQTPATADTTQGIQLRVESRQRVDEMVEHALAAGGTVAHAPNDQGFLYGRSFQDLDGHHGDVFTVDPAVLRREQ